MRKIIFTLLLLTSLTAITAQVTIQPTIAAVGLIQKDQLWNVLIVNSSTTSYDCRLKLILRDRITGVEIFAATTSQFTITAGAKQINVNAVNPVQYNYLTTAQNNSVFGFIPAGTYSACYTLTVVSVKEVNLAQECINFDTEPLSPPMLINPVDSSTVISGPAQFSWIPPTPAVMFDRLQYDFIITEIKAGQKPAEAIQENVPFYNAGNLANNVLMYPAAATPFEKNKWYAWQVVARDDRQYAGKSETWVFSIKNDSNRVEAMNGIYLLLEDAIRGTYQLNSKMLHLKYFSSFGNYKGEVIFTNEKGEVVKVENAIIKQGDNYFDFELSNRFKPNIIYTITIKDKENKQQSLSFRIN